jgi:hypothetical protein
MSFAKQNPQRIPVMFLAALMWLVAMGPFLHMHLGSTHITGFHVDGLTSPAEAVSVDFTHSALSATTESESPALTIPASHTRKASEAPPVDSDSLAVALFMVGISFICGLFSRTVQPLFSKLPNIRYLMRHSLARLTHAPPTSTR